MATYTVTVFSLILIQALLTRHCDASYEGCYRENQRQRVYDVNPGDYDPSAMTPDLCKAKCGAYGKKYSALTYGSFCFCGDNDPDAANSVNNNPYCQDLCSGDNLVKCGGQGYVSLYKSSPPITGLQITDDVTTFTQINNPVAYTVTVTSGSDVYYQMDYGDGAGLTDKNATGFETSTYQIPGTYTVRVQANDFNDTLAVQKAVTTVVVQAPLAGTLELECDSVFATYDEGKCVATVWQGTSLELTAGVITASLYHDIRFADPVISRIGPGIPTKPSASSLLSQSYTGTLLAQDSLVENAGRVIGWKVNVETTGTLKVLILSPACGSQLYCPYDNKCQTTCPGAPQSYAAKCTSGTFCPRTRLCDTGSCTAPTRFSATALTIPTYTVKAIVDIAVVSTGYQYVSESSLVEVSPGDILGLDLQASTGAKTYYLDCPADRVNFRHTVTVSQGASITTSGLTQNGDCMALQAVVSEGSSVYLPYFFTAERNHVLMVTVKNKDFNSTTLRNSSILVVQEGVNFTIIEGPEVVITNAANTYTVQPHTGSTGAKYTWDQFGDGSGPMFVNVSDQSKSMTFTAKGIYNLTVTTANAVSSKTNVTTVIVQDSISGLDVTAPTAAANEVHSFQITLTSGSDYSCHWDFGDGQSTTTDQVSTPTGSTTTINHTYTTIGNYAFSVNCSNLVSSQKKTLTQKVQQRITGLALAQQGQDSQNFVRVPWKVTTGSDVTWTASFAGSPLTVDLGASNPGSFSWISTSLGIFGSKVYTVNITGTNDINSESISEGYTLTTAIVNFNVIASTDNTTTGNSVVYTVTMTRGSNVNVTLEYKDGNVDNEVVTGDWSTTKTYNHVFNDGGRFMVEITASNPAGTHKKTLELIVIEGVGSIQMFSPDYALYAPPSYISVWFSLPAGKSKPTEPKLVLDFNYKNKMVNGDLVTDFNYTEQYDDRGLFNITATVSNSLDTKAFYRPLAIIDILQGPQIVPAFSKAPKGEDLDVKFTLYRGPKAPYCNLTWDIGDGVTPPVVTDREGEGQNGFDIQKIKYTTAGTFPLTVTATTPLQSVSHSINLEVVVPVVNSSLQVTTNSLDNEWTYGDLVKVTVKWTSTEIPDVPKVDLSWGDGKIEKGLPYTITRAGFTKTFSRTFSKDGLLNTKITVYNDASSADFIVPMGVYKSFDGMTVERCYVPDLPTDAACQTGLTAGTYEFSSDKPVRFTVKTTNDAKATYYSVVAKVGTETIICNRSDNPFELLLNKSGSYSVDVTAFNPLFNKKVTVPVTIVEKVVGLEVSHNQTQKNAGVPKDFFIQFLIQGTKTCLMVDWGDGKKSVYADTGETDNCNIPSFSSINPTNTLTGTSKIQHPFTTQKTFTVVFIAKNAYGEIRKTLHVEITGLDCSQPQVTIVNGTKNFVAAQKLKKGDYLIFRAIPQIVCSILQNTKKWTIEIIDRKWGNVSGSVDLAAINVNAATAELSLNPWTLGYNLYKITFTMSMITNNPALAFTAVDYAYYDVGMSDLVGIMTEGGSSEITRGFYGGDLVLTPLLKSYDPDVVNNNPAASGMSVLNWTCSYKNGSVPKHCSDVEAAGTTGSGGKLVFDVRKLDAGETYRIGVYMGKGVRVVLTYINVVIVQGDPPKVNIKCIGGSICHHIPDGFLVPRTSKLSLDCGCENCAAGDNIQYEWGVYLSAYRWPDGWRPVQRVDLDNHTVGRESQQLQLKPSLFEEFKDYTQYKVQCNVTRNGAKGWAATKILLNSPPKGGKCIITPKEMTVTTDKLVYIFCSDWSDDTGILEFRLFSFFDEQSVLSQITTVKSPQSGFEVNVSLSQGQEYINFDNYVRLQVVDIMGAIADYDVGTVKVKPVPTTIAKTKIDELLTNPTNELLVTFAEGDLIRCTEVVTAMASLLNSDSKDSQSEYQGLAIASTKTPLGIGPWDATRVGGMAPATEELTPALQKEIDDNRDKRSRVRDMMCENMATLPTSTQQAKMVGLSGIAAVLRYPDEVNRKSQEIVMAMLDRISNDFDSGPPVPPEERNKLISYTMNALSAAQVAVLSTSKQATKTDRVLAETDKQFKDYPVENSDDPVPTCIPEDDVVKPYKFDNAFRNQQQETCCKRQLNLAKEMRKQARKVKRQARNLFSQNSIVGETLESFTDFQRNKFAKVPLKKAFAPESVNMKYSKSKIEGSPNINDIIPAGLMNENDTVLVQVEESSDDAARCTPLGLKIETYTRFISISVYAKDQMLNITNTPSPFYITIANTNEAPQAPVINVDPKMTSWNRFQLHKTKIKKPGSSLHFTMCAVNRTVHYVVVMSLGSRPNPAKDRCNKVFYVNATKNACFSGYMDNHEVNSFIGKAFIGVRQLAPSEIGMDASNCSDLPNWKKGEANATEFTGNYTLKMFSSSCYVLSEHDEEWSYDSCRVHANTSVEATVCECNHLTTFAGGWVVVPNTIDWNYVFNNLDFFKNPTLYVTEIVIILVYILAVIWARRKDRKDVEKLGIAPLLDNDAKDKYYYEIVVVTGMRRNAGTDSKVFFILSGEEDETDVREFSDSKRKIFRRGETNGFLVATPRPLGYLNYARVWHDNSGKGSMGGWYMNYMIVRDVQTDEKWVFIADKWFAVEEDDGQVDRIIPVATRENMTEFSHMFAERTRKNLADGHLWFSVVARPPASRFTCVQRVSCCLCLLYVSMLANAMFYKTSSESGTSNGITFGPFSVSPEQIFIGVISNLIVFPVNFIIITLFRKSRPRKLRPSRVDEAIKTAHDGPRSEASVTDIKPEVSSIFSVSRPNSMMANPKPPRPDSSLSRPGTSLSARADASLPTKKKKAKSLPWWCRIVGWAILWISTLVSAALVTAYGVTFADEMCKKWISSMLVSFFMSVFITQPIKVFLIAIFLSLIIKNPGEEEEEEDVNDEEKTKLANDEIPLHELNAGGYGAARPRKIGYKPPDRSTLEAARQKRMNEIQMWSIVREVVIYSFFLWILLVISYRQRNSDTFLYKDTMERVFIKNNETDIDFEKIRNVDEYYNWARSGLVNGIRAGPYYNDYPPLLLRGYVNDKVSKILGYATMRQLRIRPSLCEMDERMMAVIRECNIGYEISDQEEGTFDMGWKLRTDNSTENDTAPWYRYTDADTLNGYPYWGQLNVYAGGGYVVPLKGSKTDLIALMHRLEQEKWIDRYTRAVFVEFTTYNAQVNLFGIACILAEFHQTGGVVQTYRFEPAMLLPYMTSAMLFQLVCEGVYCCFIIFFIVRLIRVFIKEKLAFFKGFWNLVEMGIIAMSLGAIIIYFYRLFETNKLTSRFKESNGVDYIKFQYVGYWNEIFSYMIAWTVFFATLKFMRLLRFNKRMSLLAATLKNGARSLLHFSIIFWIVFLAFSMLFFLSYMTIDIKYSSFIGSVVSGILMMMGKFDIYAMTMAEPVLTQIFVFLFVVSVTFIIVNMFVSILNETFSAVRDDVSKQPNDYEIINFMITRFKRFTGMGPQANTTLTPEEIRNQELEQRYAEGRGNSCVDDFPERIDRLLHSISNVYMEQEHMSAMMDKRGYQHGGGLSAKGYDNPGYVGPRSKTSEMSKVHTH